MTRRTKFCLPFMAFIGAIVGAVVVLSVCSATEAALIRFRPRVVVTGRIITLGDIAEVTDPKAAVIARLKSVPLAPAPAAGRERRISYETVRSRLSAVGVNLAEVEFAGNSVVTVSVAKTRDKSVKPVGRIAERVPAWKIKRAEQLLSRAIGRYVARRAPRIGNVTVRVQLAPQDVSAVLDGWTYGFELRGGAGDFTGTQLLNLRVMDRHSRIHEITVRGVVTPVPRIVVARYMLPSGHRIQPADLTWRQAEAGAHGFTQMEAVINKETRKSIRQGARILSEDIRAVPLIRSNEIVTVRSRVGGIVVTSRMKSRTAGTRGETVTLVTLDGRRRVEARVSGYHEAEVLAVGSTNVSRRVETTGRVRFQHLPIRPQAVRRVRASHAEGTVFRPQQTPDRPSGVAGVDRTKFPDRESPGGRFAPPQRRAVAPPRPSIQKAAFATDAGRTGESIRSVSDRTFVPITTPRQSARSPRTGVRRVRETDGVSEWRSLEPHRAAERNDHPVHANLKKRIKPAG